MPIAVDRELRVTRSVDLGLGPVRGQRDRLVQVAINLLQNAIRFSPAGGEVGLVLERGETGWQRFIVRDAGPGIVPGDEEVIFDRFRQGARRPGEQIHGFGLGLYVVKAHVELFGGRVAAANRPEGGAEFVVSLMNWGAREDEST